jgi:hypothetical protein
MRSIHYVNTSLAAEGKGTMVQGSGLWSDWENKVKEAGERDSRKGFVS